ncbi:hypothetical protein SAMN05421805_12828 [Saccharopolyspora antimicrobica]|uniref:Uncharacterized protein n=1 Tax=Saccharopolyspora antimicrobica TaxID=455193 RepID=A0A1I5KUV3_9PSEU|nr:hypothetical protein [Saccharopolyspora antimicrobica]RKT89119.1 hypothetical protein ATL45_7566 [Saccharopolyspora antimicrobica]SFO88753.1 hypothetical protein SAMN05421805_12828 [Saccharopolyspora antimicrobica]
MDIIASAPEEGTATPQQFRTVKQEWARRRKEERRRAHRHYEEQD